jgi:hypothetical protein
MLPEIEKIAFVNFSAASKLFILSITWPFSWDYNLLAILEHYFIYAKYDEWYIPVMLLNTMMKSEEFEIFIFILELGSFRSR